MVEPPWADTGALCSAGDTDVPASAIPPPLLLLHAADASSEEGDAAEDDVASSEPPSEKSTGFLEGRRAWFAVFYFPPPEAQVQGSSCLQGLSWQRVSLLLLKLVLGPTWVLFSKQRLHAQMPTLAMQVSQKV